MSTKTTLKRIALVAVSALGFGLLSVVPSSAATVTEGATAGLSVNTSSITLIDSATDGTDATYAAFEVSLTNTSGIAGKLASTETLTATVISSPKPNLPTGATAVSNVRLGWGTAWNPTSGAVTASSTATTASFAGSNAANVVDSAVEDLNLAANLRGGKGTETSYTDDASKSTATYALKVSAADTNNINDAGFYEIRISVIDSNGNAIDSKIVKFGIATDKLNSGAVLTTTVTGSQVSGSAVAVSAIANIKATLADANGGLIREGANTFAAISGSLKDAGTDATPPVYTTTSLTFSDAGVSTATTGTTLATRVALNGTYEAITTTLAGVAGTGTVTVRYGAASASADLLLTTAAGAGKWANTSASATGSIASGNDRKLPLSTKTATVTATVYDNADIVQTTTPAKAVAGYDLYYTVTYEGCVLGDMTPAQVRTPTKVTTDANGQVKVEITDANPNDGCAATVAFTGATVITTAATGVTKSLTRVLTWEKPKATSALVSPAGAYSALLLSSHKLTFTVLDQFSAPMAGETVTFSHSGANAPAATTTAPSAITDANGQVSYSWTDSKGVVDSTTLGFDTAGISAVGTTSLAKTIKVTYVATMPAIASLYATYTTTNAAATPAVLTGTVPTTAIGGTTGVAVSTADQIDTTKVITATNGGDKAKGPWVTLNFQARKAAATTGTAGVPTTVTVTGAQLIDNNGKLGTSVTVYANEDVYVLGTKTGTATVTATNGTITSTATINFVNAEKDARVLALKESAGLVTATVTDAFGNAVAGVKVDVVGSGGAWLGNGATSAQFLTATDGTVTFAVTGAGTVTASLNRTDYAKPSNLANAGNSTGSVVTTGAPAGVRSASVTTSGRADAAADAANAANDAAAEAIDAANAATDAANLAAEAADAATVAAEEARDAADAATAAVEELATQVATLMAALKAQITTLANTVAKIAKKVKA